MFNPNSLVTIKFNIRNTKEVIVLLFIIILDQESNKNCSVKSVNDCIGFLSPTISAISNSRPIKSNIIF